MKIAICISGQPRNVEQGFEYIRPNLIEGNDVDVFVHTWWNPEVVGTSYMRVGREVSAPVESDVITKIGQLYNPVSMLVQHQIMFDEKNYAERAYPSVIPFASLSHKYSLMRVHELRRECGRTYDVVVRIRFDLALQTKILFKEYDLNTVHIPNGWPHPVGTDDAFAFGNPANMDVFSNLFNCMEDLYERGIAFCDELLLNQHLIDHDIPVKKHDFKYDLIRNGRLNKAASWVR